MGIEEGSMKHIEELMDLNGKTAIVTGGAKGIGLGIVNRLSEAGAYVLIADNDEVSAKEAAKQFVSEGRKCGYFVVDVSDESSVKKLVEESLKISGKLDILVNNAGIYPAMPISEMTTELFEKVLNINLKGAFLTTKYASQAMKNSGGGKIINITSIDALHPSMVGLAHYDASKHGMWGFTKNSALELAKDKIWVNAIAPGGIQTPGVAAMSTTNKSQSDANQSEIVEKFLSKIPMHRMGEPDDIGKVALFLASDLSSYMTGSQIVVDGGVLLS